MRRDYPARHMHESLTPSLSDDVVDHRAADIRKLSHPARVQITHVVVVQAHQMQDSRTHVTDRNRLVYAKIVLLFRPSHAFRVQFEPETNHPSATRYGWVGMDNFVGQFSWLSGSLPEENWPTRFLQS